MASGAIRRPDFPKELPHNASGRFVARQPDFFHLLPRAGLGLCLMGGWDSLASSMWAWLMGVCSLIRRGPLVRDP
eukprot:128890-Heterocapsa_arctica.AAC.1